MRFMSPNRTRRSSGAVPGKTRRNAGPNDNITEAGRDMTPERLLLILLLMQVKHLLADYVWQTGWMVANKGRYGHPGGIAHAGMHAVFSLVVVLVTGFTPLLALGLALFEFVVHYHVDWSKDQILRRRALDAKMREYWIWTGVDQFAHQITMLAMILGLLWWG